MFVLPLKFNSNFLPFVWLHIRKGISCSFIYYHLNLVHHSFTSCLLVTTTRWESCSSCKWSECALLRSATFGQQKSFCHCKWHNDIRFECWIKIQLKYFMFFSIFRKSIRKCLNTNFTYLHKICSSLFSCDDQLEKIIHPHLYHQTVMTIFNYGNRR